MDRKEDKDKISRNKKLTKKKKDKIDFLDRIEELSNIPDMSEFYNLIDSAIAKYPKYYKIWLEGYKNGYKQRIVEEGINRKKKYLKSIRKKNTIGIPNKYRNSI